MLCMHPLLRSACRAPFTAAQGQGFPDWRNRIRFQRMECACTGATSSVQCYDVSKLARWALRRKGLGFWLSCIFETITMYRWLNEASHSFSFDEVMRCCCLAGSSCGQAASTRTPQQRMRPTWLSPAAAWRTCAPSQAKCRRGSRWVGVWGRCVKHARMGVGRAVRVQNRASSRSSRQW